MILKITLSKSQQHPSGDNELIDMEINAYILSTPRGIIIGSHIWHVL